MHRTAIKVLWVFSIISLTGVFSWAADEPGSYTAATESEITKGLLQDEKYSIKPLVGAIAYRDVQGSNTGRAAAGLTMDMNAITLIEKGATQWYVGPAIGAIFSHMGEPTSNFFGADATQNANQGNANILIMPANLKAGYAFTDYYRIGVHGGGNVIYRSVANSMNLGEGSESSGTLWKVYPSVGGDLDIALGKSVAITLRPDWTLTPADDLFTGSLGVGIFLG